MNAVCAYERITESLDGGCQAEIGSAIGMAAGALVEMKGVTPAQAVHAVGLAQMPTGKTIIEQLANDKKKSRAGPKEKTNG